MGEGHISVLPREVCDALDGVLATAGDEPRGVHLTGLRAGRVAQEAGAKQLVLTHLPPWNEDAVALAEARTAYTGPITVCEPLGVYRV